MFLPAVHRGLLLPNLVMWWTYAIASLDELTELSFHQCCALVIAFYICTFLPILMYRMVNYDRNMPFERVKSNMVVGYASVILANLLVLSAMPYREKNQPFAYALYFMAHMTVTPVLALGTIPGPFKYNFDYTKSQVFMTFVVIAMTAAAFYPLDTNGLATQSVCNVMIAISSVQIHNIWAGGMSQKLPAARQQQQERMQRPPVFRRR